MPTNPRAREALAEKRREELQAQTGVTRCALCPWTYVGSMIDGIHEAKKHRGREHPEREVEKKRKKPKPWMDADARSAAADARAEKEARRSRVLAAARKLGPGVVKASEIAREAGISEKGIGQVLRALGLKKAETGRARWELPPDA